MEIYTKQARTYKSITAKQGKNRLRWNHDEEYATPK